MALFYKVITTNKAITCRPHNTISAAIDSYKYELFKLYGAAYHDKIHDGNPQIISAGTIQAANMATIQDSDNNSWYVIGPVNLQKSQQDEQINPIPKPSMRGKHSGPRGGLRGGRPRGFMSNNSA